MNKSEEMRQLARQGLPVADIARRVGVRYQFARNVLNIAGLIAEPSSNVLPRSGAVESTLLLGGLLEPVVSQWKISKSPLTVEVLLASGFTKAGSWVRSEDGRLQISDRLPKEPGVYSFASCGEALYVGLATMGLAKRLYFYGRPSARQMTNIRVNGLLKAEIQLGKVIDIYTATPTDLDWNGLPVSGHAGLELGLIEGFSLPWNIRGVRA